MFNFLKNKIRGNFKRIVDIKYKNVNDILNCESIIMLHVGCGTNYMEGWINIDNNSDNNIKKLDFMWDLREPLPFPESSVDFIFNEHFLEHLTVEEGKAALQDFKRILKPSGVLRIAMPDLADVVSDYLNLNWKEERKEFLKKYGLDYIKTRAENINICFRCWGHKWLYDWEELDRRLNEVGFSNIEKCRLYESEYPELRNIESRPESRLIAEVKK